MNSGQLLPRYSYFRGSTDARRRTQNLAVGAIGRIGHLSDEMSEREVLACKSERNFEHGPVGDEARDQRTDVHWVGERQRHHCDRNDETGGGGKEWGSAVLQRNGNAEGGTQETASD
jgi:hypothetical protein